ncbi:MAG: hypothetical protein ACXAEN_01480 [Candidatus Thorarchaeota archaeon]|jgi:predicted regulator of Ras-like GTPase activity (Roadblock/LC7/MglB family)
MAGDTLTQVTGLLKEALDVHGSVMHVVLSTGEGVVVAAVSREEEIGPHILSTVSAAITWAGTTILSQMSSDHPLQYQHSTEKHLILSLIQTNYQLVVVFEKHKKYEDTVGDSLSTLQSLATRIELVMGSSPEFRDESILGRIVKAIPEIGQAMLITAEGMPVRSVGFGDQTETAALAGSMFANGLTLSQTTDWLLMNTNDVNLFISRVDDARLLVVVVRGEESARVIQRIKSFLVEGL